MGHRGVEGHQRENRFQVTFPKASLFSGRPSGIRLKGAVIMIVIVILGIMIMKVPIIFIMVMIMTIVHGKLMV